MNQKIKSILKPVIIFLLGMLIGAILVESLEVYVRPTYRQLIGTDLKIEQEFLAIRAARENKPLETTLHRWAAVNAESEQGFRVFQKSSDQIEDQSYLFPFQLLALKWMYSPDNVQKGKAVIESIDRGKLAVALEALGRIDEADQQWKYAQQLTPELKMEMVKKSVNTMLAAEKTEESKQAEDAVLGPRKK